MSLVHYSFGTQCIVRHLCVFARISSTLQPSCSDGQNVASVWRQHCTAATSGSTAKHCESLLLSLHVDRHYSSNAASLSFCFFLFNCCRGNSLLLQLFHKQLLPIAAPNICWYMMPMKEKYVVVTMNFNKSIMSSTVRRVFV